MCTIFAHHFLSFDFRAQKWCNRSLCVMESNQLLLICHVTLMWHFFSFSLLITLKSRLVYFQCCPKTLTAVFYWLCSKNAVIQIGCSVAWGPDPRGDPRSPDERGSPIPDTPVPGLRGDNDFIKISLNNKYINVNLIQQY